MPADWWLLRTDQAPDWDIPISLIMAGFCYLSAAWSLQVIVFRVWRLWPLMLVATWWAVDGCYALLEFSKSSRIGVDERSELACVSLSLFGLRLSVVRRQVQGALEPLMHIHGELTSPTLPHAFNPSAQHIQVRCLANQKETHIPCSKTEDRAVVGECLEF